MNQPRTGDPVSFRSGARDPWHQVSSPRLPLSISLRASWGDADRGERVRARRLGRGACVRSHQRAGRPTLDGPAGIRKERQPGSDRDSRPCEHRSGGSRGEAGRGRVTNRSGALRGVDQGHHIGPSGWTSSSARVERATSRAAAPRKPGARGTAASSWFDGRWVAAMVVSRSKRLPRREATRTEPVWTTPSMKNSRPSSPGLEWKRTANQ